MINMNDVVAERGGLRLPNVQPQQPKYTASQDPVEKAKEESDVYASQGWAVEGYQRFEYGYYNSKGQAVSTAGSTDVTDPQGVTLADAAQKKEAADNAAALIENLKSEKTGINDIIKKHASGAGISDSDMKKLKIEIDSSGKIVVGGIKDSKKAKALQESLNKEAGLANRIKDYQNNEKSLKSFFTENNIGGLSLASGAKSLDHIKEIAQAGKSPDELGHILNDPLAVAAMELYGIGGPDFSSGSKGVADPKGALKDELNKAKKKIEELFTNANLQAEQLANEAGKPDGAAAADKMSLTGTTIKISADGAITFEGRFAQSDSANSQAEAMIRMVLDEMLKQDDTGIESTLATAARQLVVNHDDEHGEDQGKIAVMEISGKDTNAYVDNPGKTIQINADIKKNAAGFLSQESGSKITADMVTVDDNGKISLTAVPETMDAKQAEKLVDMLNQDIKDAAKNPASAKSEAVAKIAALLAEKASYGPGSTPTTYAATPSAAISTPVSSSGAETAAGTKNTTGTTSNNNTNASTQSPSGSKAAQERRQKDYNDKYLKPEFDEAFEKWCNGEGEFNINFIGKYVGNGYAVAVKEDSELHDLMTRSQTFADGNSYQVNRFYQTKGGKSVPIYLDDVTSGKLMEDMQKLKSITPEDTILIDKTGLDQDGFSQEERDDFLRIIDDIIKGSGYEANGHDFYYRYEPDKEEYVNSRGELDVRNSGTASFRIYNHGIDNGQSGSKYYTSDELEDLTSYINEKMLQTDELWEKGYAQKLAMNYLAHDDGISFEENPFKQYFRWS